MKGLSLQETRALSKTLHRAAAQYAQEEDVCAFDLIEACQVSSNILLPPPTSMHRCLH